MKQEIEQLLSAAVTRLTGTLLPTPPAAGTIVVERTRDSANGDFASNVAMRLAKGAGLPPRTLAQAIVDALPASPQVLRCEVAGAGFINFYLAGDAQAQVVRQVHELGDAFGRNASGAERKVIVEFVSSNPTGPLHVGHGRHGAFGASVANLLAANGWLVHREYYINDAGRQMDILAASIWLRYLEACGERFTFPANGYKGDYIRDIAANLLQRDGDTLQRPEGELFGNLPPDEPEGGDKDEYIDALIVRARSLIGEAGFRTVLDLGLAAILADIEQDLGEFGVTFDRWYSERSLADNGAIDRALHKLAQHDHVYEKDGALWFRATAFGDDKDRVVVRDNGVKTYFASDIAYHLDKRERGFDLLLDILGSDHHGYVARVRAGLDAMGEPGSSLEALLVQFVTLYRGGEKAQMSTRSGEFITLRELRNEVGNDACRFFYVMRGNDQHLDFDLELAKSRSNDNPVYYIQYAHARVASVLRQLESRGLAFDGAQGLDNLALLTTSHEAAVLTALDRYPEIIRLAADNRAPHALVHYLRELANSFHTYYNAEQFIVDDAALRNARLALVLAVRQVIRNGLTLLGVSAPDTM
ncbi:MAG: arginine--tRNA ligase [Proteobacteria bacterium]|nr:arginine--tRNA ligase [Pseudomonadota bacterium]